MSPLPTPPAPPGRPTAEQPSPSDEPLQPNETSEPARGRAIGAFIGLAVGDALGATLEFYSRDALPLHHHMTGGGSFALPPGVWTDDTSMALCLADSLIERRQVDRFDIAARLCRWEQKGENSATGACFDIGHTTSHALQAFIEEGVVLGGVAERSAGNGSLVRCAPVAIVYGGDAWRARDQAMWQSSVTHNHPACLGACAYLSLALSAAFIGLPKAEVLVQPGLSPWTHPEIAEIAAGEWLTAARSDVPSGGYVIETLRAALWAISQTDTFEDALILAVNLAGDADSVGAVAGQLAGALYGYDAIPERWLRKLAWRNHLQRRAEQLYELRLAQPRDPWLRVRGG